MCPVVTSTADRAALGRNVSGDCCDPLMAKRDGKGRRPARRRLSAVLPPERVGDMDIRNRYNEEVRWEILLLEPVNDWFLALCKNDRLTADKVEEALGTSWPCAGRSSAGRWPTAFMAARSIISRSSGPGCPAPPRCACSSCSTRSRGAIVLAAGDKAGRWRTWYAEAIPLAGERYAAYQRAAHEEEE